MHKTWILVADEERGRIFAAQSRTGPITELEALVHPESRLHESDLSSDSPGSNRGGMASGISSAQHGINERGAIKHASAVRFAKEISNNLTKAFSQHQFTNLAVVAAPKFLGLLRKEFANSLHKHICYELDKDFSKLSASEIRQRLPERLPMV